MCKLAVGIICGVGTIGLLLSTDAHAQSLYQPYYYSDPEPYQQVTSMAPAAHLESFNYDPKYDPKRVTYTAPTAYDVPQSSIDAIDLETKSGVNIGLQISDYSYQEPSLSVKLTGAKFGVTIDALGNLGYGWYLGIDTRYAAGNSSYTGSGTQSGNFENLLDTRLLFGKDFLYTQYALSPFSGLGFRHFYSDERGLSSTGSSGYRRVNNLLYLPFGVKPRFRVTEESRITTTLEYDLMLKGLQMSMLSDVDPGNADVHNSQKGGYGLRGDIMWEHKTWGIGPFLNYWNISQSNTVCSIGTVYENCGYEPANSTVEGGVQFKYHFF